VKRDKIERGENRGEFFPFVENSPEFWAGVERHQLFIFNAISL
jgi:hypothetical protein